MKNLVFAFVVVVSMLNFNKITAQSLTHFGVKSGVNVMEIKSKFDESTSSESNTGFYVGVFMEFIKSVNFSIQPEILYSSAKNQVDDHINLLHIPVLLNYKIGNKFTVYVGPESQFLLKVSNTNIKSDMYKKFILAANIGMRFLISENLLLDARYNLAVSKYIDYGYRSNEKLNFIQVGLAYTIDK